MGLSRSVVAWGAPSTGGDGDGVQDQLQNVEKIQTNRTRFAFAACKWVCRDLGRFQPWW